MYQDLRATDRSRLMPQSSLHIATAFDSLLQIGEESSDDLEDHLLIACFFLILSYYELSQILGTEQVGYQGDESRERRDNKDDKSD